MLPSSCRRTEPTVLGPLDDTVLSCWTAPVELVRLCKLKVSGIESRRSEEKLSPKIIVLKSLWPVAYMLYFCFRLSTISSWKSMGCQLGART